MRSPVTLFSGLGISSALVCPALLDPSKFLVTTRPLSIGKPARKCQRKCGDSRQELLNITILFHPPASLRGPLRETDTQTRPHALAASTAARNQGGQPGAWRLQERGVLFSTIGELRNADSVIFPRTWSEPENGNICATRLCSGMGLRPQSEGVSQLENPAWRRPEEQG